MDTTTSPNRLIAAFLAAKTRTLSALRDEGGLFEIRFLGRIVSRERAELDQVTRESAVIAQREQVVVHTLTDVTSLHSEAGAAISPRENRRVRLALGRLRRDVRHHALHLAQL